MAAVEDTGIGGCIAIALLQLTWDYPALGHGGNSLHRTAGYVTRMSRGVGGRGREASSYPD